MTYYYNFISHYQILSFYPKAQEQTIFFDYYFISINFFREDILYLTTISESTHFKLVS